MTLIGQFSRISELRDIIFKGNEKMTEVKAAIKVAKEKLEDADNRSAAEMLEVRAHVQKIIRKKKNYKSHLLQAKIEYESLKKKAKYESDIEEDSDKDVLLL